MFVFVVYSDQLFHSDVDARFLPGLLDSIVRRGKVVFAPSARHGPAPVILPDQQDFAVQEDGRARIDLGCLITGVRAENLDHFVHGEIRPHGQHLRGNIPDPLVAFPVIYILPVIESRLRNALQFLCPFQNLIFHLIFLREKRIKQKHSNQHKV